METIELDSHKRLIFKADCFLYLRSDVFSEEFKEKIFFYKDLKSVEVINSKLHWWRIFLSIIDILSEDDPSDEEPYKTADLTLLFIDGQRKVIDLGAISVKRKEEIRDLIILYLGRWVENQQK